MAIDTAAKRKSCIGLAVLFLRTGIIPTGSNLSNTERLHTNGLYAVVLTPSVEVSPETITLNMFINQSESLNLYVTRSRSIDLER